MKRIKRIIRKYIFRKYNEYKVNIDNITPEELHNKLYEFRVNDDLDYIILSYEIFLYDNQKIFSFFRLRK